MQEKNHSILVLLLITVTTVLLIVGCLWAIQKAQKSSDAAMGLKESLSVRGI
jgi:hypothetical protein